MDAVSPAPIPVPLERIHASTTPAPTPTTLLSALPRRPHHRILVIGLVVEGAVVEARPRTAAVSRRARRRRGAEGEERARARAAARRLGAARGEGAGFVVDGVGDGGEVRRRRVGGAGDGVVPRVRAVGLLGRLCWCGAERDGRNLDGGDGFVDSAGGGGGGRGWC